jgi:hypothetical protein
MRFRHTFSQALCCRCSRPAANTCATTLFGPNISGARLSHRRRVSSTCLRRSPKRPPPPLPLPLPPHHLRPLLLIRQQMNALPNQRLFPQTSRLEPDRQSQRKAGLRAHPRPPHRAAMQMPRIQTGFDIFDLFSIYRSGLIREPTPFSPPLFHSSQNATSVRPVYRLYLRAPARASASVAAAQDL